MPKIYEYFGLVFLFKANDHEPVHVHVQHAEFESKVTFIYDSGALVDIRFDDVPGKKPVPKSKRLDIINFVKVYHAHIVSKWIQFYVFKQKIHTEKITKRVKP